MEQAGRTGASAPSEPEELMRRAVGVWNRALAGTEQRPLWVSLLTAADALLDDTRYVLGVYEHDPDRLIGVFEVHYRNRTFEFLGPGGDPSRAWKMRRDYLAGLIEDEERYVANPLLIDWDFLATRLAELTRDRGAEA